MRHRPVAALPTRRVERAPQTGRRIMLCPPGDNGIAKYLSAALAQSPRSLEHPALFDLPKEVQQLRRINFCNGSGSNLRNYVLLERCQDLSVIPWSKSFALVVKPLTRDDLKRGLARVQCFTSFGLLCRARVSTLRHQCSSIFATSACNG